MNYTKALELAQGYGEKALALAKPYGEEVLLVALEAWEKVEAIDWLAIGEKLLKGYLMAIAAVCFVVFTCAKWVWSHRMEVIAAVALTVDVTVITASWLWDEFVRCQGEVMSEFVAIGMAGVLGLTLFI